MANISDAAWASIEGDYGRRLMPEIRGEVDQATVAVIERTTADFPMSMKPAIKRVDRLRNLARKLHDEWAKGRVLALGSDEFFADILIARGYPVPHSGGQAPPWDDVAKLIRVCDAAERELEQMQIATPVSRRRWKKLAWEGWVVALSDIVKRHGLPGGAGYGDRYQGGPSPFVMLVRALQQHALPADVGRSTQSAEALNQAIKRALRAAKQGQI